jgi:hypothetical protein
MPYEFDRYVDGQLMAEGCQINNAGSLIEALEKAIAIYTNGARPGEMERTRFVLRGHSSLPKET